MFNSMLWLFQLMPCESHSVEVTWSGGNNFYIIHYGWQGISLYIVSDICLICFAIFPPFHVNDICEPSVSVVKTNTIFLTFLYILCESYESVMK